jgi:hypothetical protein
MLMRMRRICQSARVSNRILNSRTRSFLRLWSGIKLRWYVFPFLLSTAYLQIQFADASRSIPDAGGPLELAWVANDAFASLASTEAPADASDAESDATVAAEVKQEDDEVEERQKQEEDADMDVAEDGDQWL